MWRETVGCLYVPFIVKPGFNDCFSGPCAVRSPLTLSGSLSGSATGLVVGDNPRWCCIKGQCETPQLRQLSESTISCYFRGVPARALYLHLQIFQVRAELSEPVDMVVKQWRTVSGYVRAKFNLL